MKTWLNVPLWLIALSALGCQATFATPPGFVELDETDRFLLWESRRGVYDHRATTADGLVISGREEDNDPEGDLAFWSRAIENELRLRGGYALLGRRAVKTRSGKAGTELRFGHDQGTTPHLYTVALFVTPKTLYLVEAGGTRELVEKNQARIDWAIENARVD